MKSIRLIFVMACSMLLLGGCGEQKTQEEVVVPVAEGEPVREDTALEEEDAGAIDEESTTGEVCAADAVTIEIGPDKGVYQEGNMVCILHDFKLYESPEDASVSWDEMETVDAQSYLDKSKFLMLQADISNVDYKGDDEDGSINLSMFTIGPKQQEESAGWWGSLPVYLSEAGKGADFYHVQVKEGETKTVAIGFFVPVEDVGQLCRECKIVIMGCYEEGYLFDIPQMQ